MHDKPLTVATYAAGASLAAIALIYVFGPTYFIDNESSHASASSLLLGSRKKGGVGLSNPANDCFINSVLQALAGLGDLRIYLIRELHRRRVDDAWVYAVPVPSRALNVEGDAKPNGAPSRNTPDWKVEGLQGGIVTKGLKDILDALNERPIYKKTISAAPFVRTLEEAFRQRISRQQQDAQEFLQIVAERLCDEYHAGRRARVHARRKLAAPLSQSGVDALDTDTVGRGLTQLAIDGHQDHEAGAPLASVAQEDEEEDGFPMEGKFESQIECLTCGFKPRPTASTFCTLTLNVPLVSSTTLNACFDGMFKTEYIDDFKCEKCRLLHAISVLETNARKAVSESSRQEAQTAILRLQHAVDTDPETPPVDVELLDLRYAPKRRIARHIRLTSFPKILAIHLSRSIFDPGSYSQKNSAKVAFQEQLPLGGLLNQRRYKLLGVVTHKGSHSSGHYESFRRQNAYPPFSNPATFMQSGFYSKTATTPFRHRDHSALDSPVVSTPELMPAVDAGNDSAMVLDLETVTRISAVTGDGHIAESSQERFSCVAAAKHRCGGGPTLTPRDRDTETKSLASVAASARSTLSRITSRPSSSSSRSSRARPAMGEHSSHQEAAPVTRTITATHSVAEPPQMPTSLKPKRRKTCNRWWRISDDKIKEASTRDVLGMQREVYLLFYELERDDI